jgi:cardiolipin synthase
MLTIPNLLTIFRIFLSLSLIFLLLRGKFLIAFLIYFIASLTDFLDGFLARKFNQKSTLGQILDPIADKILIFITYFGLYFFNVKYKPGIFLLVSILIKEFFIILGSIYLFRNGRLPKPTLLGKLSVALLMVYGGILLVLNSEIVKIGNLNRIEYIVNVSIWLAIFSYLFKFLEFKNSNKTQAL